MRSSQGVLFLAYKFISSKVIAHNVTTRCVGSGISKTLRQHEVSCVLRAKKDIKEGVTCRHRSWRNTEATQLDTSSVGLLPLLGFNSEILPIVYLPPSAQPCLSVEGFDEREWTRRSPATGQSGTSGGLRCCKTRRMQLAFNWPMNLDDLEHDVSIIIFDCGQEERH